MPRKPSLLHEFLKDKNVASLVPTSRPTVKKICDRINFDIGRVFVEYGPGTGVITDELRQRMHDEAKLIAIELNHELAEHLQKKYERDSRVTVFEGSAESVRDALRSIDEQRADTIVSGIPFSLLSDEKLHELLMTTDDVLSDDGKLLVYQVRKMRTRKHLRQVFGDVKEIPAPLNIPPLWIFEMSKAQSE